jgi:UDP-glucose 4-epimerase
VKRVLVTGASGFVGQPLVSALARDGYEVRATYRRPENVPSDIDARVVDDLGGSVDSLQLVAGVDAIIHLAGIAHIGPGIPEADYHRVNYGATAALANASKSAGVERFIFMSSIRAQCGPSATGVLTETSPAEPSDAYGRSKLAAEIALRDSGVPYTILRPVLIYGPNVKGNLRTLMRLAAMPVPLPFAALSGRRSMVGIDNLIGAVRHSLTTPACANETFVVADPGALTLPQIIATWRAAAGRPAGLFRVPPQLIKTAFRLIGRHDLWERIDGNLEASAARLAATGWQPTVDTAAGLAAMIQPASGRKSGAASRSTR